MKILNETLKYYISRLRLYFAKIIYKVSKIFYKTANVTIKAIKLYDKKGLSLNTQVCAFSFLFSLYPIVTLLVMVCFLILKANPAAFASFCSALVSTLNAHNFALDPYQVIAVATTKLSLTFTNVILIATIIWLSRRLFLAIFLAMSAIFGSNKRKSPVIEQLLTMGYAVIFVVALAAIFILSYFTRQFLHYPIFNGVKAAYPWIYKKLTNALTNGLMYFILLIFTFCVYKAFAKKAKIILCLTFSVLCTLSSFLCTTILSTVVNKAAYTAIYGVAASLIIMLIEVMAFFGFFMIFACFIAIISGYTSTQC